MWFLDLPNRPSLLVPRACPYVPRITTFASLAPVVLPALSVLFYTPFRGTQHRALTVRIEHRALSTILSVRCGELRRKCDDGSGADQKWVGCAAAGEGETGVLEERCAGGFRVAGATRLALPWGLHHAGRAAATPRR